MGIQGVAGFQFFGIGVTLNANAETEFRQEAEDFWSRYLHAAPAAEIQITVNSPPDWRPLAMIAAEKADVIFDDWGWRTCGHSQTLCGPGCVLVSQAKQIDVYLEPGKRHVWGNLVRFALNFALIEQLRRCYLYYVHAACLQSPAGKTFLVAADAGHGKSTITTGLLASGFRYLSDDAVFLDFRNETKRIWGYQKAFHLGADLLERYNTASLRAGQVSGAKWEVDPESLFPGQALRSVAQIDVVLIPEISSQPTSVITPVRPIDTLLNFFKTSTQVFFEPTLAEGHLLALREVAHRAKGYRFLAGADVYKNPQLYAAYLSELA